MTNDDGVFGIRTLLWEHAHPTLLNEDRDQIAKLAEEILRIATDRGLWTKWSQYHEEVAEQAASLWIPMERHSGRAGRPDLPQLAPGSC
jgi:hypothetical protein